jgi:hypothetical protein
MTPNNIGRQSLTTKLSAPNLGGRNEMDRGMTPEEIEEWTRISSARPALPFNSGLFAFAASSRLPC